VKVLITGAGGQLGLDLADHCLDMGDEVVALPREDLDVANEPAVVAAITDHGPQVVFHCGAWTDVDGCESDPERAHRINALGPWWVARACDIVGATMVHLSTDHVFGGAPRRGPDGTLAPWTEFDTIDPVNAYGRSKAAGEVLIRQALREHHVVRTAWVVGARGHNFVRTMLRLAREGGSGAARAHGQVRVVDDQHGSPTFTRDLAPALRQVAVSGRYGTWHLTNAGSCSWFELAATTFELAGIDVNVEPIATSELGRPALRPAWSVLSGTHATAAGIDPRPDWRDGLARLLDELDASPSSGED
jgi:dTDP-4-dehydrorhamnose reductase